MSVSGAAPVPAAVREVFWQARQDGRPVRDAAVAAGVSHRAAWHWLQQRGGVRPRRPVPASGRFLCLAEREEIAAAAAAGAGVREIARQLGRAPSTISRELARNRSRGGYRAVGADRRAQARRARPRPARLAVPGALREEVLAGLARQWSPEEISARLVKDHPGRPEMRVCPETIYQSIYIQGRGALRRDLASALRTGRAIRRPQRRAGERRSLQIAGKVMISERPPEVADRAVPGHWEGDLIIGKDNGSAIGTLVERVTRYVILIHLPGAHGSDDLLAALPAALGAAGLPPWFRKTLTWDQGAEMTRHADIAKAASLDIYFCDPRSPWQRGTNENTNGLLRQYFPKGTSLRRHAPADLAAVADRLNGRPRKTLAWDTPAERLAKLLLQ
jgi:transposase, IS30 family